MSRKFKKKKKKAFVAVEIKTIKMEVAKEKSYLFPFFSAS